MKQGLIHFNRGRVSPLALARADLKRVAMSADVMTNWMPRVLGPMSLRPGLEYITSSYDNESARYIPFIFATDDTALVELTATVMRVLVDESPVSRNAVTAQVTDGTFVSAASLAASWTPADEGLIASSAWDATSGHLGLTGTGDEAAIRYQQVVVTETGTEHSLRIVINRGPVILRVGSAAGLDDYISETTLYTGEHSLSFTPTGNFWVQLMARVDRLTLVESCTVESSGVITFDTPWTALDLANVRWDQSGDVIFVACEGHQQRRIERRGVNSWSIVEYLPEDGPFRIENVGPITITPSALTDNITLTASKNLFKFTNIGSLYRLTSEGQTVTENITAENTFTDPIKVTGITSDRIFTIDFTTAGSTVTLQRSLNSATGPWADVPAQSWNYDVTSTFDDGLDNQIVWYQIGVKTGNYVGAVDASLIVNTGGITGVCRVTDYTSPTVVSAEVLSTLGGTDATDIWSESLWSDRRGWPTSVALHEGRLWWSGKDRIVGSVSDAFDSFDPDYEGDAGPISRTIGSGPVDTINWVMSLQRLILGGQGAEFSVRSSSFDEPITPTNFMIRDASTQGSANVPAVKVDQRGIYVQRGGARVYELAFETQNDYNSTDLTVLVPEMGIVGITRIAVQRQPDTRIHCVKTDGTAMVGVYDRAEDVLAWVDIETDGWISDVVTLPGTVEDTVYYFIRRDINGVTKRYLEKWALESNCRGGLLNYQADSLKVYSGGSTTTITGLSHLEGETVCVWADGKDVGTDDNYAQTYQVVGGQITLAEAAGDVVVGLPYTAQFKSVKLAPETLGTVLSSHKRIDRMGLLLKWVHPKGLRYGQDFTYMDDMPEVEEGVTIDQDGIRETYAEHEVLFPGKWDIDARICLQAQAPRPCTVMAAVPDMSIGG